jgi:hypothetical protein
MAAQQDGTIVNVSSLMGKIAAYHSNLFSYQIHLGFYPSFFAAS